MGKKLKLFIFLMAVSCITVISVVYYWLWMYGGTFAFKIFSEAILTIFVLTFVFAVYCKIHEL